MLGAVGAVRFLTLAGGDFFLIRGFRGCPEGLTPLAGWDDCDTLETRAFASGSSLFSPAGLFLSPGGVFFCDFHIPTCTLGSPSLLPVVANI